MYRDNQKRKDWERQYYLKNRKIKIEYAKNRYKCNKEELLGRQKIYERERYSISRIYKQLYYLRNREIILSRQRKNILTLLKQNDRIFLSLTANGICFAKWRFWNTAASN